MSNQDPESRAREAEKRYQEVKIAFENVEQTFKEMTTEVEKLREISAVYRGTVDKYREENAAFASVMIRLKQITETSDTDISKYHQMLDILKDIRV